MELPQKGTMRPIKKVLGGILLVIGLGLVFMPDTIAPTLDKYQMVFGIIIAAAGYFHLISGRQL